MSNSINKFLIVDFDTRESRLLKSREELLKYLVDTADEEGYAINNLKASSMQIEVWQYNKTSMKKVDPTLVQDIKILMET